MSLGEVLPVASVIPFAGLLLSIALLPQLAPRFWHSQRNQLAVSLAWASPVLLGLGWLAATDGPAHHEAAHALGHAVTEYVAFMALLGSLYVVAGGILLRGDLEGRPRVNTAFLAAGAVLANFVGTTGASMLLVRPLLRTNSERHNTLHIPVFFIFVVSNVGGALTPIGDPPLFLGYLRGVPFGWTFSALLPMWLPVVAVLLAMFYAVDRWQYVRETRQQVLADRRAFEPLRLDGRVNLLLLAAVIACVLWLSPDPDLPDFRHWYAREIGLAGLAAASVALTPRALREANGFGWGPILEVAALFAGIFLAMIPATALLEARGGALGITEPWQYFWATGVLSSFLDNAPTYVTFAAMACGSYAEVCPSAEDLGSLIRHPETAEILRAISLGAVFMGAMTYVGNGPNFMVRAIAVDAGYRMPSFFGYMGWAVVFLLPVFLLMTVLAWT